MSKPKTDSLPAKQGESKVGPGCPPEEHQFKPGQSGNPAGPPRHRTQLWLWICKYMGMRDAEIKKLRRAEMTQVQKVALKIVKNATQGKESGAERLARYCVDRDEGKASEHLIIDKDDDLSPEECEEIALKTQQLPEGVKVPGFDNLIGVACLHLPAPAKYFEAEDQK